MECIFLFDSRDSPCRCIYSHSDVKVSVCVCLASFTLHLHAPRLPVSALESCVYLQ